MNLQEALEWVECRTLNMNELSKHQMVCVVLAAAVRELEAENKALHEDGMTIYAMMNDERVDKLKAENAALRRVVDAAEDVCWFDWSDNDGDAVMTVEKLRCALRALDAGKDDG